MEEIWKPVVGLEKEYLVSSLGNVRKTSGILMSIYHAQNNYRFVSLNKTTFYVHRLVAHSFIPNPENKPEVNHKNSIKWHNYVDNLEWVTKKENMAHAYKHTYEKWNRGEKVWKSKLTKNKVLEIRDFYKKNNLSMVKVGKIFNVSASTVFSVVNKKTWGHVDYPQINDLL